MHSTALLVCFVVVVAVVVAVAAVVVVVAVVVEFLVEVVPAERTVWQTLFSYSCSD